MYNIILKKFFVSIIPSGKILVSNGSSLLLKNNSNITSNQKYLHLNLYYQKFFPNVNKSSKLSEIEINFIFSSFDLITKLIIFV